MKRRKMFWSLMLLCFLAIWGVSYALFQAKNTEASRKPKQHVIQLARIKKNLPSISNSKEVKSEASPLSKRKEKVKKEERKIFNKVAVDQNYYLEHVDAKGTLTYVKATFESLEAFEEKNKVDYLSIYQVNFKGQRISVLTLPEGK